MVRLDWLITLSVVAGLAAVELLVRTLDTDLARAGRSPHLAGSAVGLTSATYDLAVTSTRLGAPRLPDWSSASSTGPTDSAPHTSSCWHRLLDWPLRLLPEPGGVHLPVTRQAVMLAP